MGQWNGMGSIRGNGGPFGGWASNSSIRTAMIGKEGDDGVLSKAEVVERVEHLADVRIHVRDRGVVPGKSPENRQNSASFAQF